MENELEIRDQIIREAGRQFLLYGIRSVTMDDIARALGISKKTIYQHFRDKEEIVKEATKAHLEEEVREFTAMRHHCQDAIHELVEISRFMRQTFRSMNPSTLHDLKRHYREGWQLYLEFRDQFVFGQVKDNLERGIEQGFFRNDINPSVLTNLRVAEIQLTFDHQVFPADQFSMLDVQMQLFNHYVFGIVTEKGRRLYQEYLDNQTIEERN